MQQRDPYTAPPITALRVEGVTKITYLGPNGTPHKTNQ